MPKKSSFTAAEVCSIIEACATRNVQEIRVGDLYIRLGTKTEEVIHAPATDLQPPVDHEQQGNDALLQDEIREKEERLAMLLLEDPEEFERQVANDELGDDELEDTDEI